MLSPPRAVAQSPAADEDDRVSDQPRKGWTQARLRIISDTVSFEWITEQLGLVADAGGNAGEPGPGTYTRTSTLWVLKSGLSNEHHLDEHIQQLLGRLGSRRAALGAVDLNLDLYPARACGTPAE
jgi:hypothetical protein